MNCYLHSDATATAFCRDCGRALCADCQRPSNGTIFCQDHAPAAPAFSAPPPPPPPSSGPKASNPYQTPVNPVHCSPGLAFFLGFIPGVGAIYNGQYAKGLVHAGIIGLLISLLDAAHGDAADIFLSMMLTSFWGYMVFEAFHTAKKRQAGLPVDEFSSIVSPSIYRTRAPIGPMVLIVLGVLFLLDTLNLLAFRELARFWPVILIAVGFIMLYNRVTGLRHSHNSLDSTPLESGREQ